MATHWTLAVDATDPHLLADFWAHALGYVHEPGYEDPDGASIVDPDGRGPAIGFLRVPEGKTAKNRLHIDIGLRLVATGYMITVATGMADVFGLNIQRGVVFDGNAIDIVVDAYSELSARILF